MIAFFQLFEIFHFVWYEINTTSDVIVHNYTFQKSFIDLKSTQNITLEYLGLDVKHSYTCTCKCSFSYFIISLYATK